MKSDLIRSRPGASEIKPASAAAAIPVADGIWLSPGLSNSYLIVTGDGRVVINTGMGFESGHHRRLYDAVDQGPVRYILLPGAPKGSATKRSALKAGRFKYPRAS